jgi:hypothetical protein
MLTPYRLNRGQKKNYKKALKRIFDYENSPGKLLNVGLVMQDADYFPKSSAFIRLIAPLTHPSVAKDINIRLINPRRAKTEPSINVYIVQRTAFNNLKKAKNFFDNIKKNNSSLITDTDDAFSEIPSSHPEYKAQRKMLAAKEFLLSKADQVWLSEVALISDSYKKKSVVIPNSLDKRIWTAKPGQKPTGKSPKKVRMVYMGTATHDEDLKMIIPALDKVYAEYPDSFRLTTIGVSQDVPKRKWIEQLNAPRFGSLYPSFVQWFLKQGPFDVGLSPLVDSVFNRAKSDIKCLDYLAAGILPIVSDTRPYQSKEIADFIIKVDNTTEGWVRELSKIVSAPKEFRKQKQKIIPLAQGYLWKHRSSEITAKKLLGNLEKLQKNS